MGRVDGPRWFRLSPGPVCACRQAHLHPPPSVSVARLADRANQSPRLPWLHATPGTEWELLVRGGGCGRCFRFLRAHRADDEPPTSARPSTAGDRPLVIGTRPRRKLLVTLGSAAVVVFPAPSDTFRPLRYFRAPRHICRISRRSRHRTPALLGVTT